MALTGSHAGITKTESCRGEKINAQGKQGPQERSKTSITGGLWFLRDPYVDIPLLPAANF